MSSTIKFASAASADPVLLHQGSVCVDALTFHNRAAAARYLKLWDKASADEVTVGTTEPDLTVPITADGFENVLMAMGFQNGLVAAVTTGKADNDATAGAARDVLGAFQVTKRL